MVDPRMPSEPVTPAFAGRAPMSRWAAEAGEHLWPWHRGAFAEHRLMHTLALAAALAVSIVWALAAAGELASGMVIGWWFGWSLLEIPVRLKTKPYVKEGPWWGARFRRASVMDMVCYVLFKNLLIGAVLFLTLKGLGRLVA